MRASDLARIEAIKLRAKADATYSIARAIENQGTGPTGVADLASELIEKSAVQMDLLAQTLEAEGR